MHRTFIACNARDRTCSLDSQPKVHIKSDMLYSKAVSVITSLPAGAGNRGASIVIVARSAAVKIPGEMPKRAANDWKLRTSGSPWSKAFNGNPPISSLINR